VPSTLAFLAMLPPSFYAASSGSPRPYLFFFPFSLFLARRGGSSEEPPLSLLFVERLLSRFSHSSGLLDFVFFVFFFFRLPPGDFLPNIFPPLHFSFQPGRACKRLSSSSRNPHFFLSDPPLIPFTLTRFLRGFSLRRFRLGAYLMKTESLSLNVPPTTTVKGFLDFPCPSGVPFSRGRVLRRCISNASNISPSSFLLHVTFSLWVALGAFSGPSLPLPTFFFSLGDYDRKPFVLHLFVARLVKYFMRQSDPPFS